MIKNLSCLQWNARGLTKSKLEEFRILLNKFNPDLVFLVKLTGPTIFALNLKIIIPLRRIAICDEEVA
jgi:hypothetical protein